MNTKLQTLVDAIHTSDLLTEAEKQRIATLASEVEKELATVAFKLERTEKIKNTIGVLLESNIEELEKKRQILEAQKRELEIEASLERVRTQAMSMKKPDDLLGICEILYAELQNLGFGELRNTMINIHYDE
jgi:D-alanyl-D-alanine dipeptidase